MLQVHELWKLGKRSEFNSTANISAKASEAHEWKVSEPVHKTGHDLGIFVEHAGERSIDQTRCVDAIKRGWLAALLQMAEHTRTNVVEMLHVLEQVREREGESKRSIGIRKICA
jgi:hypothetical protein